MIVLYAPKNVVVPCPKWSFNCSRAGTIQFWMSVQTRTDEPVKTSYIWDLDCLNSLVSDLIAPIQFPFWFAPDLHSSWLQPHSEVQTFTCSLQTQKRIVPKDLMCQDSIPLTSIKPSLTILPLVPSSATGSSLIRFQEPSESALMDWLPSLSQVCQTYIELVLNSCWTYIKLIKLISNLHQTQLNDVKQCQTMSNSANLIEL